MTAPTTMPDTHDEARPAPAPLPQGGAAGKTRSRPRRFNILIFRGEGAGVLRLNLPRSLLYGGLIGMALACSTLGAIFADYVYLKRQFAQMPALQRQAAEQQALIEGFQKRIAEIRTEISTWSVLHTRMSEAFGPEAGLPQKSTGIGGGEPARPDRRTDGSRSGRSAR